MAHKEVTFDAKRLQEAYQAVVQAVKARLLFDASSKRVAKLVMLWAEGLYVRGTKQVLLSLQHLGELGEAQVALGEMLKELFQLATAVHDGSALQIISITDGAMIFAREDMPDAYMREACSYDEATQYAAIIVNDLNRMTEFQEAKLSEEQIDKVISALTELITARLQVSIDDYQEDEAETKEEVQASAEKVEEKPAT